jgi:L-aminopeptidase/D-esterase-like protein
MTGTAGAAGRDAIPEAWLATPGGRPRARALGVPFDGTPGPWNAITDVAGVAVGYRTLVRGTGPLRVGEGPVRTGVTAILPRPRAEVATPVFAGLHSQNGNGELTGAHLIAEVGLLALPVTITNTHACGIARDATIEWARRTLPGALDDAWGLPVAAETYDGYLNDVNGGHVTAADALAALDAAREGPLEEGSVGGGTGMIAFELKAGSGTASRRAPVGDRTFTVGVFVQANFGRRRNLMIRGRRVGPALAVPAIRGEGPPARPAEKSSIIGVVATDAPLLPHQLARLARRAPLGVAWTGGVAYHGSGDIFLAFSTANAAALGTVGAGIARAEFVPDDRLDPLFDAVVQGVEEAILNSLVASPAMEGRDGHVAPALPHDAVRRLFGGDPA